MRPLGLYAPAGRCSIPENPRAMNDVRRSLLGVTSDYTLELIWIMAKYDGCTREVIESLLQSPRLQGHILKHWQRVKQLLERLPQALA